MATNTSGTLISRGRPKFRPVRLHLCATCRLAIPAQSIPMARRQRRLKNPRLGRMSMDLTMAAAAGIIRPETKPEKIPRGVTVISSEFLRQALVSS